MALCKRKQSAILDTVEIVIVSILSDFGNSRRDDVGEHSTMHNKLTIILAAAEV